MVVEDVQVREIDQERDLSAGAQPHVGAGTDGVPMNAATKTLSGRAWTSRGGLTCWSRPSRITRSPSERARQETAGRAIDTAPCAKAKAMTRRSSRLLPGSCVRDTVR
ncbi:hypothetical protein PUR32_31160 [Streptomyces sp. BE133]|nr:hypothetical protein [Streptomyces sp. BE133]MEE1810499.1 hypothetical protein [Streptomyces sp. BE133]